MLIHFSRLSYGAVRRKFIYDLFNEACNYSYRKSNRRIISDQLIRKDVKRNDYGLINHTSR
jgi:hypothetical protein